MRTFIKRAEKDRRQVVDPRYLGVKSRRKRGKEPRRREDRRNRVPKIGPLGF